MDLPKLWTLIKADLAKAQNSLPADAASHKALLNIFRGFHGLPWSNKTFQPVQLLERRVSGTGSA